MCDLFVWMRDVLNDYGVCQYRYCSRTTDVLNLWTSQRIRDALDEKNYSQDDYNSMKSLCIRVEPQKGKPSYCGSVIIKETFDEMSRFANLKHLNLEHNRLYHIEVSDLTWQHLTNLETLYGESMNSIFITTTNWPTTHPSSIAIAIAITITSTSISIANMFPSSKFYREIEQGNFFNVRAEENLYNLDYLGVRRHSIRPSSSVVSRSWRSWIFAVKPCICWARDPFKPTQLSRLLIFVVDNFELLRSILSQDSHLWPSWTSDSITFTTLTIWPSLEPNSQVLEANSSFVSTRFSVCQAHWWRQRTMSAWFSSKASPMKALNVDYHQKWLVTQRSSMNHLWTTTRHWWTVIWQQCHVLNMGFTLTPEPGMIWVNSGLNAALSSTCSSICSSILP